MNPQRLKIVLPIAFLILAIVATVVLVQARPVAQREERVVEPPLVRVLTVQPGKVPIEVVSQGTVRSHAETAVVAQVAGRIDAVAPAFARGGTFRRGEVLLQLDRRDYEIALAQAEAAKAQAELRLAREEAESQIAREEWDRIGQGQPSALVLRQPQLAEARAAVAAANASILQARLNIERSTIRAPFDGVLLAKHVDVGQFVAPGAPVAAIAASDYAEVELPVPARDLAHIDVASAPRVHLRGDAGGGAWTGRIVRTAGQIDPSTRMLALVARVERPFAASGGRAPLRIGEFVRASIEGKNAESVITVPRGALRQGRLVLVADASDRLQFRDVAIFRLTEREALINGGLAAGERVVLSALDTPVEGMLVRTTEERREEPVNIRPVQENR